MAIFDLRAMVFRRVEVSDFHAPAIIIYRVIG